MRFKSKVIDFSQLELPSQLAWQKTCRALKPKGTILYLHGFDDGCFNPQECQEMLPSYHHYALSLPFHYYGQFCALKRTKNKLCLQVFVNLIKNFIQQEQLVDLVLVGHGLGGVIAAALAVQLGPSVKKVVLVAPVTRVLLKQVGLSLQRTLVPTSMDDLELAQKRLLTNSHGYWQNPLFRAKLVTAWRYYEQHRWVLNVLFKTFYGYFSLLKAEKLYRKLTQPVLVLIGEHDQLLNPISLRKQRFFQTVKQDKNYLLYQQCLRQNRTWLRMGRLLRHGVIKLVPKAAHHIHLEAMVAYCLHITEFLNSEGQGG